MYTKPGLDLFSAEAETRAQLVDIRFLLFIMKGIIRALMVRSLKFENFLLKYCQNLTDCYSTTSLLKFANELDKNPRAEEPVLLYALQNKRDLNKFEKSLRPDLQEKFNNLKLEFQKYKDLDEMLLYSDNLSVDFKKVYNAYKYRLQETSANNPMKRSYGEFFDKKLKELKLTNYRVCKELGLNLSNFTFFLKGHNEKLSLENCEKVYDYLMDLDV